MTSKSLCPNIPMIHRRRHTTENPRFQRELESTYREWAQLVHKNHHSVFITIMLSNGLTITETGPARINYTSNSHSFRCEWGEQCAPAILSLPWHKITAYYRDTQDRRADNLDRREHEVIVLYFDDGSIEFMLEEANQ